MLSLLPQTRSPVVTAKYKVACLVASSQYMHENASDLSEQQVDQRAENKFDDVGDNMSMFLSAADIRSQQVQAASKNRAQILAYYMSYILEQDSPQRM